jgi:hypothetical protein
MPDQIKENMNLTINETYTFKVTSGEELVAKVVDIEGQYIVLSDPVSIIPSQRGVGLQPSMFTADPDSLVRINTTNVTLYAPTEDGVKMKYIEAITGIKVPDKKLILG